MYNRKKSAIVRLVVMIIVIAVVFPVDTRATIEETIQPYASKYLSSYNAYVYLAGGGEVDVYFNVEGTGMMDELGALSVSLYESTDNSTWTWKTTFTHDSTLDMLGYNDFYYSSHVTYQGVEGRYYKAYVCVWAGKDGDGDTRYFWTSVKPTSNPI